jgi:2-polyprenyl-6-methoxyphenol hydroxylase-like FAD-dependent oxidoreductase
MGSHYRVAIAGFGIAGGALAVLLARAGHTVTLLERAPAVGPVGAGFLLQPSGQAVLRRLGLLESVIKSSEPIHAVRAFRADGQTLVHLRHADVLPGHHAYGVHRGLLFRTLQSAVEAAGVQIRTGQPVAGWRESGPAAWAVTEDGTEHGPFDFLVAADGARSALRQALNPGAVEREYAFGALWLVGAGSQVRGYLHQITRGTRNLLGLLPIGGGQCALFWLVRMDAIDAVRQMGFAAWRRQVLALSPLAAETLDDAGSFDRAVFAGYRHSRPRRVFSDRLVCVGDAAHASSPHLGQGANLALLDAETLAASLETAPGPAAAFRDYDRRRRGQIRYYAAVSRLLTPFFQSSGWLLGAGRDLALPLMMAVPPIRRQMELAMTGVKTGWLSRDLPI